MPWRYIVKASDEYKITREFVGWKDRDSATEFAQLKNAKLAMAEFIARDIAAANAALDALSAIERSDFDLNAPSAIDLETFDTKTNWASCDAEQIGEPL